MCNILHEIKEQKKIIALYTDADNYEKFMIGYVISILNGKILVLNVGLNGEFDGYSVINTDDIYRIEVDSKYIKKIKSICKFKYEEIFSIRTEKDLLLDLLNSAINRNSVVAVSVFDSDNAIFGYVKKIENNKVYILQVNEYGEDDGYTIFLYNSIRRCVMEDIECRILDDLYNMVADSW